MSPETGKIYTPEELTKASKREQTRSVPITDGEEKTLRRMNRHERKAWAKANLPRAERMRRRAARAA